MARSKKNDAEGRALGVDGANRQLASSGTLQERARGKPNELPKISNQMSLVVVARVCGDARPVLRDACPAHCALQANGAREILGPDANAFREGATQVPRGHSQPLRNLLDPALACFDQVNRVACQAPRRRLAHLARAKRDRARPR